jgi:serine carboxypeptidase-like clade 1
MFRALLLAALVITVKASVKELLTIPGWPDNEPLPARLFSGYANLTQTASPNTTMLMHYLVFLSEGNPSEDPILVWFNGGPGATSAWGLFVENGPLMLNEGSLGESYTKTGIPEPKLNPFRWTTFATMIVLEAPPPIGFSYCTPPGPTGNGTACGVWNDTRCGEADAEALGIILHDQLPQLLNGTSKIFLMGESYAGVFISETVSQLLKQPERYGDITSRLEGIGLGDACLGTKVLCGGANGWYNYLLFMYGHAQFPTELWEKLSSTCTFEELNSPNPLSPKCQATVNECQDAIGGFYAYNLYDQCTNDMFSPWSQVSRRGFLTASVKPQPFVNIDGYWCPGHVFDHYFKNSKVREAFGVPENKNFFNSDNAVGMEYIFNEEDVLPLYRSLLEKANNSMRILVYNGDADPAVTIFETQSIWYKFADNFTMNRTQNWRPWTVANNIVGGSVTSWVKVVTGEPRGTLSYVTIRGSGHMVPEYRPAAAKVMTEAWIRGDELPKYNPQSRR